MSFGISLSFISGDGISPSGGSTDFSTKMMGFGVVVVVVVVVVVIVAAAFVGTFC